MDSATRGRSFDPLDLEILDRVYEAAKAHVEARDLYRQAVPEGRREETLRKTLFSLANGRPVDFDALYAKVVTALDARARG